MSLRPPRGAAEDDGNPLHDATWLYSYADLMTQLLIFAILMLTSLGLKELKEPDSDPAPEPVAAVDPLAATVRELDRFVAQGALTDVVSVDRSADKVVIRMRSLLLFQEGQATLTSRAQQVMAGVVPLLAKGKSQLRVEGHTDDVPIRSGSFPSNWELSSARAISVVRYLEEQGLARDRLSVAGYGEFHPIIANDSAEHRAMNRRVEIVVLGERP